MDDLVKQLMHATVSIDGDFDVGCNVRDAAVERLERSEAALAAAYEVAADSLIESSVWCDSQDRTSSEWHNGVIDARKHHMNCIRAITTPDQAAALDRLIAEAEARTVEQIAELVSSWRNTTPMTGEECANAILAASKKGGQ